MFLSRVSEKSQLAFLPLGLGGAFNLFTVPTGIPLSAADAPTSSDFQSLPPLSSVLFIESPLEIASPDAADPFSKGLLSVALTDFSKAQHPFVTGPFVTVESRHQPVFLTQFAQPKIRHRKEPLIEQKRFIPEALRKEPARKTAGAALKTAALKTAASKTAASELSVLNTVQKPTRGKRSDEKSSTEKSLIEKSAVNQGKSLVAEGQITSAPITNQPVKNALKTNDQIASKDEVGDESAIALSKRTLSQLLDTIDLSHTSSAESVTMLLKTPPHTAAATPNITNPDTAADENSAIIPPPSNEGDAQALPSLDSLLPYEVQTSAVQRLRQSINRPVQASANELATDELSIEAPSTLAQAGDSPNPAESNPAESDPAEFQAEDDISDSLPQLPSLSPARSGVSSGERDGTDSEAPDDELGRLRVQLQESRKDEDLGILRLLQTAKAPPPRPEPPIAYLSGRVGYFDTDNAFRISKGPTDLQTIDNQIYQAGLSLLFFPKLSETTNLYAIAETNIARYGNNDVTVTRRNSQGVDSDRRILPNYNELELQVGLRHKLFPRTYAQLGWRHQVLFNEGYRRRKFTANYIDAQLSHRAILNSKTWLDGVSQTRIGFTSSSRSDRFRQTFLLSFNHKFTEELRTTVSYQLDFTDFTRTARFDTYQQVLGIISYRITPESRISLFGGTRFGNSSRSDITLDDTFYGASLNVTVPLF